MVNRARLHGTGLALLVLGMLTVAGCTGNGAALFHDQGCIHCHRFQGEGGMMGPDLTAVADRRSDEFINRYIHDPAASNPHARMPAFPQLTKQERWAIIAFLKQ